MVTVLIGIGAGCAAILAIVSVIRLVPARTLRSSPMPAALGNRSTSTAGATARARRRDDDGVTDVVGDTKFWHSRGRFWWTGLVLGVLIVVRAMFVGYPTSLVELTVGLGFLLVLVTLRHPRGTA
jgi:hypothetical protein